MNYKKKSKQYQQKDQKKILINKFSILNGAKYFSSEILQSYLVSITAKKIIKYFTGTTRIELWRSNRMLTKSDSNFCTNFC